MHYLGGDADYEKTLSMQNKDLSKLKLLTGSIYKNNNDTETINLNFFGKNFQVTKSIKKINEEVDEKEESKEENVFDFINEDRSLCLNNNRRNSSYAFDSPMLENEPNQTMRADLKRHRRQTINAKCGKLAQKKLGKTESSSKQL